MLRGSGVCNQKRNRQGIPTLLKIIMGRPKLNLTEAERKIRRSIQVVTAYRKYVQKDPDRAKEKRKNQKDIYRQEHPEYSAKQAATKRLARSKIKEELKALRRKNAAKEMREQAKEPAMKKKIGRCFK